MERCKRLAGCLRKLSILVFSSLLLLVLLAPQGYSQQLLFFGKVVDTHMNPLEGAEVSVFSDSLLVFSAKTDKDGSFNLIVPPGTYTLRVSLKGFKPYQMLLVAVQERAGSLGTIVLEPAVELYTATTELTVYQGDLLAIPLKLVNRGSEPLQVTLTVDAPQGWTAYFTLPGGLRVGNILVDTGSNQTVIFNVYVPLNASGKYSLRVDAAWENLKRELVYSFTVIGKSWSIFEFPASSIVTYPGAQLKIPFQVANPFPIDVEITFSQSVPQDWIAAMLDQNSLSVSGIQLKPKEKSQLFLLLYVSPKSLAGNYQVVLYADIKGLGRYVFPLTVILESRYDLLNLTVASTRLEVAGGSTATTLLTLRNDGNAPALALVEVTCSCQGLTPRLSLTGQNTASIYILPGEVKQVNLIVEASPEVMPGVYELRVQANGTTSYAEKLILVNITGTRRLVILNENYLTSAAPGSAAVFRLRVSNAGTYPLSLVRVRVDAAPAGFTVSVEPDRRSLLPGEEGYFDIRVVVPPEAREGVYEVQFTVEGDGLGLTRVLVLWVQRETSLSFTLIMAALVVASFVLTFYGRRR